jgi:ubiquinone biosynthesis protein COQ4
MIKTLEVLRGAHSFVKLVQDPGKLGQVFTLSDKTASREVLERLAREFGASERGKRALAECHRLPPLDLAALARLPEGTLGREFADHMRINGLDPAAIPTLNARDSVEFVRAHLYETHDIWHVVVGFATDVTGELGLQGFYLSQFSSPLPPVILAAGLLNTAFYAIHEFDSRMRAIVTGWTMGKKAQPLFGVRWDQLWETPLAQVREDLGLDPRGLAGSDPEISTERAGELAIARGETA